ncbi:MAG: hypothetical protein ACREMR_08415 [Gemmatimonadales bacterium]
MRTSSARLTNSSVRLADLSFPQVNLLIRRTRLVFIHLDNLLALAKRDREGRVDGYIAAHLPDECLLLFLRKGEAVNAASLHTSGREVVPIAEAMRRLRAEAERGDLTYCAAPLEQLAWMHASCAGPAEPRVIDAKAPSAFFPALRDEGLTAVVELIANGRVSYLRFEGGRFVAGYFCDRPPELPVPKYVESLFRPGPDGTTPVLSAAVFPAVPDLPVQAPAALINTYRELYWRVVDAVEQEFPGEAAKRAQRVATSLAGTRALPLLAAPRGADTPPTVVQAEDLAAALTDWTRRLLEELEVVMPGTAPRVLREATKEHRYVLQAAGFYGRLPWPMSW